MLSLPRLALQSTQHSQPTMHPMFTAQFSVPMVHVAPAVPSVLGVSCMFSGSWCSVPEGVVFATARLMFGVDASRMPSGRMLSLLAACLG